MPLIATALAFVFKSIAVMLVVRVLFALGLGITAFIGAQAILDAAQNQVMSAYDSLPADMLQLLSIAQLDYAISITFAAISFKVTYGLSTRFGPRITQPEG